MASAKPTKAQYVTAMERHGTTEWTADDARTAERYLQQEDAPAETVAEVAEKTKR